MEEEDARNFTKTHFFQQYYNAEFQANPRKKGKSCSHFFLKFVFIALFLSLLPLFPSNPPEFISHTVFAKSWELIHLLIIGIALSYGLFCRRKTTEISPKTRISQPFAPNILHHSSIFDYEEGNSSGVFDKNVIPTQSFNLSHYRTEPFVELRRENCKVFDEKPLGLPVRSLKSRVVDSDSDSDREEECASDCDSDSDLSGNKSSSSIMSRSEKDENLEGNVGGVRASDTRPTILRKLQSTRADIFMEESSKFTKFQATQLNSECFRSPAPEASSCQNFSGFCSWLPESPNMERENNFNMPFSNFNQVSDYNLVGVSPNLENTNNFFMAPTAVPSSMPFSGSDFASGSRTYNYGNEHWGSPNFVNGNLGVENSGFFVPSPAVHSPMSVPDNDFASRSRRYNHGTESWSESPILQNETLGGGENTNIFMPSAAFPHSIPASADAFASPVIASKIAEFNHATSLKKMDEMRSENNNKALGGESTNNSVPSAAFPPSMPVSANAFASSVTTSKIAEPNHGSSVKNDEMRTEINNVALGGETTNIFVPSAAFSPSMPASAADFASSKSAKFNRGSSFKKKDEIGSENNNVALSEETTNNFVSSAAFSPSVPTSAADFASSKSAKVNLGFRIKDETRSENNNVALGGENANIFVPSAKFSPSMPDPTDDFLSSVKASKSAKVNLGSSLKKKDEMRTENSNVAVGSFQEGTKSHIPHNDVPLSGGKSPNLETADLGSDKPNFFMKTDEVLPSVPTPVNELASSVKASTSAIFNHEASAKKDEERSEKGSVGSIDKGNSSYTPHFVDPFSSSTPRVDVSSKKNKQRPIPERWDSGCFEIPLSENNDSGDFCQGSLSPALPYSSEAPSSAGSSSRISCHEQGSPRNEVEENVPWSAPMNNLEIENVIEDVLGENDSYKPSTPSPPLQIQTRRNDLVVSPSVESSSRAGLGNQSFLSDNDNDQRSPPTPERRKALSRASHSRRFSCGSFFDRDLRKSFKGESKEVDRKTKAEHQCARGAKCGWDCLNVKPTMNKASLKGKSVRTVRPKEIAQDLQKTDLIELKLEGKNEGLSVTNGGDRKGEKPGMVVIQIGISEKKPDSNGRKGEKLQGSGGTSIVVGLSSKQNSNGKAAVLNDDVKAEENDSEIDRKADEFIAKFKQQIRLQKVAPRGDSKRQHKKSLYQA